MLKFFKVNKEFLVSILLEGSQQATLSHKERRHSFSIFYVLIYIEINPAV